MEILKFKQCNVTFAKDQDEYLSLPAYRDKYGEVTCCWGLSFRERLKVLFTGKIWLMLLTFNKPLQPMKMFVEYPFEEEEK